MLQSDLNNAILRKAVEVEVLQLKTCLTTYFETFAINNVLFLSR